MAEFAERRSGSESGGLSHAGRGHSQGPPIRTNAAARITYQARTRHVTATHQPAHSNASRAQNAARTTCNASANGVCRRRARTSRAISGAPSTHAMERDDEAVSFDQCDQYRSSDALHHVLHHLPRPRECQHGGCGVRQGIPAFAYADRPRVLGLRVPVSDLSGDGRLGQRPLRRAAHAADLRRDLGRRHLADGFRGRPDLAAGGASAARFRRRRDLSRRDGRDGALGRERQTRLRAGRHARGVAGRQCDRAGRHRW
jgi:hypothetical protein